MKKRERKIAKYRERERERDVERDVLIASVPNPSKNSDERSSNGEPSLATKC